MMSEILMLAAPVAVILAFLAWLYVDDKHWEARTRAAARPVTVRPFPNGVPRYTPPLDLAEGRAARRARHGGTG